MTETPENAFEAKAKEIAEYLALTDGTVPIWMKKAGSAIAAALEAEGEDLSRKLEASRGRVAELEAAIKPFAEMAKRNIKPHQPDTDGCEIVMSVREMRVAVAAYEGKQPQEDAGREEASGAIIDHKSD